MKKVKTFTSPMKFYIDRDLFKRLPEYTETLGKKPYLIVDPFLYDRAVDELGKEYTESEIVEFGGENSQKEIDKHVDQAKELKADYIIGIGGGKTLDNAKAAAWQAELEVVSVPTLASSDAPGTAISVLYTEDHQFEKYLFLPNNPDILIADLDIIANAPAETFSAGIADAIATWIEGRTSYLTDGENFNSERASYSSYLVAKNCYETVRKFGVQALEAIENNLVTDAVSNVVEANIWMSGMGAESSGTTAAHAIHNGMTELSDLDAQHGEIIGFTVITTLILEGRSDEEIFDLANFLKEIKLPLTLEDLGLKEWKEDEMRQVAEASVSEDDTMGNMTFDITVDDVYDALKHTNDIMQRVKDGYTYTR